MKIITLSQTIHLCAFLFEISLINKIEIEICSMSLQKSNTLHEKIQFILQSFIV